ncbi:putative LPS assembly protein LptD [Niabella terrae]
MFFIHLRSLQLMRKFKRIYYAVLLIFAVLSTAIGGEPCAINNTLEFSTFLQVKDTIPVSDTIPLKTGVQPTGKADSLAMRDTLPVADSNLARDSSARLDTFTLKLSKDSLSAPIKYHAEDSAVGLVNEKIVELYGKATTEYGPQSLAAPYMRMNQATGYVTALAGRDSLGEINDYVKMNDGETEYQSDSLSYNFKTQKGIIRGTITQQGEMFVHADIAKKVNENTAYLQGSFFTTCNLDHPHFGFRARRAKIVNKKLAVTGAVRPEFDSVPVPVYLPFGFYPLYQGRHSGFMAPSFETNDQMGLGLSGFGYYHVLNDHWDVKAYGDVYSFGTWNASVNPTYKKIYKYQGQFNFTMQSTRRNFRNDPDFYSSKTYSINWSHSSDTRSRPGVTFSANVNAASTNYNQNIPNNPQLNYQNVMGSSITYSKQWIDKPFNLTLSANHNQNNQAGLITVNFPDANFTVSTLYPLQKKESVSRKWYEQLGVGYSGNFRTTSSFYDKERAGFRQLWDTLQWTANHSIPVSLSLPPILGGAVVISPSISYSQQWVDREMEYGWGPRTLRYYDYTLRTQDSLYTIDTVTERFNRGIYIKQQTSFGLSFNTALYGQYRFKSKKLIALRHVLRPTFGLSYSPDLNRKYWSRMRINEQGDSAWVNRLGTSGPVNQFVSQRSGGINFGLDNNLELKVRAKPKKKSKSEEEEESSGALTDNFESDSYSDTSDKDAEDGIKKIKIIDGFGFNGSYNFLADSFRLSPINIYFRTNLFEKININATANLVPYKLNDYGYATPVYAWTGGKFSPGTITNASISMSTSFQSKPKDPDKAKAREKAINETLNDPMLQADQQRLLEYMQNNPAEFVDFNTPWSINLSYSLSYSRRGRNIMTQQSTVKPVTSSVNMSGSFNLTPKWNFSVNGYYDITTTQLQTFTMSISRDLHCWQMSINVTPVGMYRFFSFTISPKSSLLQDLKINRTRSFTNTR